jgi:hypothetical protein
MALYLRFTRVAVAFLLFWATGPSMSAQPGAKKPAPPIFGVNLLKNPGAEADPAVAGIPHWKTVPAGEDWSLLRGSYGAIEGEWAEGCGAACGLAPNAGKAYFRLPADTNRPLLGLVQEIDLAAIADTLAARQVGFILNGHIAGRACSQPECAEGSFGLRFYDRAGKELSALDYRQDANTFTLADSNDQRMHKFRAGGIMQFVPPGTVRARVVLQATNKPGCCPASPVFFDNLSFILKKGERRS